jgi:vacuolar protein sorting-associated protein 11
MLNSLPEETTQLLIDLCTSSGPLTNESADNTAHVVTKSASNAPSYLSYLALNRATAAPPTVTSDSATPTSPSVKTLRPGDTASRLDSVQDDQSSTPPSANISASPAPRPQSGAPPSVKLPSPKLYFAHFVDHMDHFVVFLETVARRRWGQTVDGDVGDQGGLPIPADEEADKQDQVMVWNTLLELYLTLPDAKTLRDKAQKVLKSFTIPYDPTHALILCSSRGYTPGLVLLWEKMGMYEDVLRFWMDRDRDDPASDASNEVIRYLNIYGPPHPHLYPLILRYLTSTPELLTKHLEDVKQILHQINTRGIMPPTRVVQMLSRNGVASVGLVKEWLMGRIRESKEEITNVSTSI